MSSHEQYSRTPMASRRVRRHAMGVSNVSSHDDNASCISRSTVSLIHADKVIKVPQRDRPLEPAARETRVEDRPTVSRVHDKLFETHGERFVHKVLRSYCPDGSGLLSRDQLRAALDRLHTGLEPEERDRVVARVAPDGANRVHYLDFMRSLAALQPLGGEQVALARGSSVPGPPTVRPGGGGSGVGDGGKSYWDWQRHPQERLPGLLDQVAEGSPAQARSDRLLTGLLAGKLGQGHQEKLRQVFRRMDADRNSVIDREEFAKGIAALGVSASRAQVDRLFDAADTDGDGVIDYCEFVERFDKHGLEKQPPSGVGVRVGTRTADAATERGGPHGAACGPPLAQTLALSYDEVAGAVRHPLVLELVRSLYGKGSAAAATAVFHRADLARCGRLDVEALTSCCQQLVPGIGERQVAALVASLDPAASPGGGVDYRGLVTRLLEAGPPHPRLAHSAPPGGHAGGAGGGGGGGATGGGWSDTRGALARFGEPLTEPPAPPTQYTRALSAVSLSRQPAADADAADATTSSPVKGASSPRVQPPPPHQPPATLTSTAARSALNDLHEVAIAPYLESLSRAGNVVAAAAGPAGSGAGTSEGDSPPAVTRSVDMGALALSQQRPGQGQGPAAEGAPHQQQQGRTDAAASTSKAPSHATGRFSRFWNRRYCDTSSVTRPVAGSALSSSAEGAFVRKGQNEEFLGYQGEDRRREDRRRQQLVQRYNARSEIDSRYSGQDDASGVNQGRLAVARAARQRYEERCEMYDRLRQRENASDHTFFGRLPAFHEHKSDAANEPTRSYW